MQIEPHYFVLMAWIFFGGTHLILSASKLRDHIVERLGPRGFTLVYAVTTIFSLGALIFATAQSGHLGKAAFNIQGNQIFNTVSVLGTFLIIAGLLDYPVSPMAVLAQRQRQTSQKESRPLAPPTPLARITRHPFFVGLALLMATQTLRAPTLAIAVYYGGFVILSLLGIYLQDRKLRAKWPTVYGDYMTQTQAIPVPMMKVKSKISRHNFIKWCIAVALTGLCVTFLKPIWFYWNGAMFGIVILIFGTLATLMGLLKSGKRSTG